MGRGRQAAQRINKFVEDQGAKRDLEALGDLIDELIERVEKVEGEVKSLRSDANDKPSS